MAVVTGATHGPGCSHAMHAEHGADVVVMDIARDMGTVAYDPGTEAEREGAVQLAGPCNSFEPGGTLEPEDISEADMCPSTETARYHGRRAPGRRRLPGEVRVGRTPP